MPIIKKNITKIWMKQTLIEYFSGEVLAKAITIKIVIIKSHQE